MLLEVMLATTFLMVSVVAVGLALQTGVSSTQELREARLVQSRAQTIIDRITSQKFGQVYDAEPTSVQLDKVFNPEVLPGDVTLNQLSRYPTADSGWLFSLSEFPIDGEWRVVVDQDVNKDGMISGEIEEGDRIFKISVYFQDKLILETSRAREVRL